MPIIIANKEFVLNYATSRWGLNKKKNVGPTSDSIRMCAPRSLQEWADFYYSNVRSYDHINELGYKLYDIIRNILPHERRFFPDLLDSITEDDCTAYLHQLVINRQYEGYRQENGR